MEFNFKFTLNPHPSKPYRNVITVQDNKGRGLNVEIGQKLTYANKKLVLNVLNVVNYLASSALKTYEDELSELARIEYNNRKAEDARREWENDSNS